jgi:hypothetical protein
LALLHLERNLVWFHIQLISCAGISMRLRSGQIGDGARLKLRQVQLKAWVPGHPECSTFTYTWRTTCLGKSVPTDGLLLDVSDGMNMTISPFA